MPHLLGLPNELLLHKVIDIVEWNNPYDLEGLALCCKEMHSIIKPKLKGHLEKRKQYSTMVVGCEGATLEDGTQQKSASHPLVDLAKVLSDDKNRLYPKTMYITALEEMYWHDKEDFPEELRSEVDSIAEEYRDRIVSTVIDVCHVLRPGSSTSDADRWIKKIFAEGAVQQPAAAALLLLAICPNLEKLDISYHGESWHAEYEHIFREITKFAMNPNADSLRAFRKLSEVYMAGCGEDIGCGADVQILCHFMALPNMTVVSGRLADGRDVEWPYEDSTSNVTELSIERSDIDLDSLRELMSRIKSLRAFCFTYCPDPSFGAASWEPRLINEALQELHAETLERLDLAHAEGEDEVYAEDRRCFIGDMRPFKNLTKVRLDAFMLFDEGKPQRLIDVFPESIAAITIVKSSIVNSKVSTLSKEDVSAMFEGLGEGEDALPNLGHVLIECVGIFAKEMEEGMKKLRELCDSRGIESFRVDLKEERA